MFVLQGGKGSGSFSPWSGQPVGWGLGTGKMMHERSANHLSNCFVEDQLAFKQCSEATSKLMTTTIQGPDGALFYFPDGTPKSEMNAALAKVYPSTVSGDWMYAPIAAVAPIPFAWLIVYALIGLWHWVGRGFKT
jgi:hypothetical protein